MRGGQLALLQQGCACVCIYELYFTCLRRLLSLQVRCSQDFTLSHGMALSPKKSACPAVWKSFWHNGPGKKHLTAGARWQTCTARLEPFSHAEVRRVGALSSYVETINRCLPADVGAQTVVRCSSQPKWCEMTYRRWAGASPSVQGVSEKRWRGIDVWEDVMCST